MPIINKQTYVFTGDRLEKAQQIEAVLSHYTQNKIKGYKILDLGSGDGEIGGYFSNENDVTLADIEDQRINNKKTKFILLKDDTAIPFKDYSFDIVIDNHVVEHIRPDDISAAYIHISEIKRVLKKDGICYFATPNKNYPIEPHHKLPIIHYFMEFEDVRLLSHGDMIELFKNLNIHYIEYTMWLVERKLGFRLPDILKTIMPTNVFILRK